MADRHRRRAAPAAVAAAVLLLGIALAGCREHEQGRVLLYEKGAYLGQPDTRLTEAQVDALRRRALDQQRM